MGAALEPGALLHKRYRIVEILGQGGMGSVYRAVDENLGMDVAVKENLYTSQEYARQFRLEAVILANLRHPNLPRVTDHFVIGDQGQYLIMDYIEGEDLRQRMERSGCVSEKEAILIGAAMCDALQYLHTRKPSIIHRDVKPGNVRITPDGHIYLVDFGLAKLVKGTQATTTGARAMTPGYSPPEQYGTARTDARTDVYSLGATLYAALTGIIPEDGLARAMDNVELTPLRKRNPDIPRKLANAIDKAMAVRPDERFQSAEEFKKALATSNIKTQRLEGEITIEPPQGYEIDENGRLAQEMSPAGDVLPSLPPSSRPRKRKDRGTRFWVIFSLFSLMILAALLSIIIFWSSLSHGFLTSKATPTSVPLLADATVAEKGPIPAANKKTATPKSVDALLPTNTLVPTFLPSITSTPTQTPGPTSTPLGGGYGQIAFASYRTGLPQIFVMDANGGNLLQITKMIGGACQPDWSPDGLHMVFISPCLARQNDHPGAKLYVINIDGGGLTELPSLESGGFDPAWSPDGNRIAFTSAQNNLAQIYVINLDNYVVTPLTTESSDLRLPDWARQPAWSPDGKQIAYTGHNRLTNALQIWAMSDLGQEQTLLLNRDPAYWNSQPKWSPDGRTILFSETKGPQALGWLMVLDYANRQNTEVVHLRMGLFGDHGSYSPDGAWVAYENINIASMDTNNFHIVILKNEKGNPPIDLPGGMSGSMDFDPAWRPVGSP